MVEPTHLKNMRTVKLDHFSRDRGENKKSLKPPPRYLMDVLLLMVQQVEVGILFTLLATEFYTLQYIGGDRRIFLRGGCSRGGVTGEP